MTDRLTGFVMSVESSRQGVIVTGWTGTAATVLNAADIDRSGCDLTPDDGATIHRCTGVVVDGDDSDVITMSGSAPSSWPAGGTDADGQDIPAEVRLDLWPEVLDVVAMVDPGDGEVIPVTVPHALRPLLSDGLRAPEEMEQVICSRQGTGWVVDDVIGLRAQVGMDGLSDAVQVAITSATGKTTITHSTTAPDADGVAVGDTWMRHDGAISAPVVGMWSWDGTSWVSSELSGAVLANLDAGTITTGAMSGIGIYSPSATATPRIEINGSTMQIVRALTDADGATTGERVTTVLGGKTGDQLQFFDSDNNIKGGFDSSGVMTSQSVLTNAVSLAGTDVLDVIGAVPQGIMAAHRFNASTANVTTTETAICDISFTVNPGRSFKVVLDGLVRASNANFPEISLRYTTTTDGTTPAKPTLSSPSLKTGRIIGPTAGATGVAGHFEFMDRLPAESPTTNYRVLLTIKSATTDPTYLYTRTLFYAEDLGSTYTGIFADGNFSDAVVETVEKTYYVGVNAATWTDGSLEVRPGDHYHWLSQGQSWDRDRNWGNGHQTYTNIWFPQNLIDDIQGAQSIAWLSVGISPMNICWPEGFVPRIARSAAPWNSGAPSASVPGASDGFDAQRIPAGGTAWVKLPAPWYPDIKSGSLTSVQFGTSAGTNHKYGGQFGYTGLLGGATNDWPVCPFKMRFTK